MVHVDKHGHRAIALRYWRQNSIEADARVNAIAGIITSYCPDVKLSLVVVMDQLHSIQSDVRRLSDPTVFDQYAMGMSIVGVAEDTQKTILSIGNVNSENEAFRLYHKTARNKRVAS